MWRARQTARDPVTEMRGDESNAHRARADSTEGRTHGDRQSPAMRLGCAMQAPTACQVETRYSFPDSVMGHCQINFPVGVEFSSSSGDPSSPESLLYLSPTGVNEYLTALWGVRGVILDYDSDKLFPAFGFEAQVPPIGRCPMNLP